MEVGGWRKAVSGEGGEGKRGRERAEMRWGLAYKQARTMSMTGQDKTWAKRFSRVVGHNSPKDLYVCPGSKMQTSKRRRECMTVRRGF